MNKLSIKEQNPKPVGKSGGLKDSLNKDDKDYKVINCLLY